MEKEGGTRRKRMKKAVFGLSNEAPNRKICDTSTLGDKGDNAEIWAREKSESQGTD